MNTYPAETVKDTLNTIEVELSRFYGFELKHSVVDHVVSRSELGCVIGKEVKSLPEWNRRAALWVVQDQSMELFVGVHFDQQLLDELDSVRPLKGLSHENLDLFCVLIEEVSHFHLLLRRLTEGRSVSKLELEFQAEVDKVLISGSIVEQQYGDPHLIPLTKIIYNPKNAFVDDGERYYLANKMAAKFWQDQDLSIKSLAESPSILRELRTYYANSLSEKITLLG